MNKINKFFQNVRLSSRWLPLAVIILLTNFIQNPLSAQQSLRIAAVVNDEMISILDLQTRISLVAALSGFDNSAETRTRLAPQVIQSLINERIRLQEAKRLEITAKKSELDAERAVVAKQISLDPSQIDETLEKSGINPATLLDQLESKIVWNKIIRSRYGSGVQISENEVDELIEDIKNNKGKPEYLTSEIYLPAENADQVKGATELASRLVQQIQDGASFSAVAQNFSQSPSAQNGGSIGWSRASQLNAEIRQVVQNLRPGQISPPYRTSDGIYIVQLRAQRISSGLEGPPPGPAKVNLHQLHLAATPQSTQARLDDLKNKAQKIAAGAQGCEAFGDITKLYGSPLSGELGTFEVNQISQQMQDLVINLPVGRPSPPQSTGDGVIVLMVCARETPKAEPVDFEKVRTLIRNRLFSARLLLSSRRYLRDLRRSAFIEIRL